MTSQRASILETIGDIKAHPLWRGPAHAFRDAMPTTCQEESPPSAHISAPQFRLWCILVQYAGSRGIAWPSLTTLSRMTGTDRSNVMKALNEGDGRFWIRHRRFSKRKKLVTVYVILPLPALPSRGKNTKSDGVKTRRGRGENMTGLGVKTRHRSIQEKYSIEVSTEAEKLERPANTPSLLPEEPVHTNTANAPDFKALETFLGRKPLSHEVTKIEQFRTFLKSDPVIVKDKPVDPCEFIAAVFQVMPHDMKTIGWKAYVSRVIETCRIENRLPIPTNGKTNDSAKQRRDQTNSTRQIGNNCELPIL